MVVGRQPGPLERLRDLIGGQVGWCLGHRPARLCCSSLPPIAESTSTRLMYLLFLLMGTVIMSAMLTPSIQFNLQSAFKDFNATCIDLNISDNCMKLTGYMALYKVSFGISMFFCLMALMNLGLTSSSSGFRSAIHNGFWVWKVLLLFLLCATTFVVPVPHLDSFHTGWLYCALGGSCVFLLVQMVLVTDFARGVSVPRPLPPPPSPLSRWARMTVCVLASLLLTLSWIAGYGWLIIRYTGPACMSTNTIIICCNCSLSVLVLALTVLPCTKKWTGGPLPAFLQGTIICCYLAYLTWCTVTSTPDTSNERDPTEEYFRRRHDLDLLANGGPYHAGIEPYHDIDLQDITVEDDCSQRGGVMVEEVWVPYTAIFIMFTVLTFASVTSWTSSPAKVLGLKLEETEEEQGMCVCCRSGARREQFPPGPPTTEKDGGQHLIRNERHTTVYSYSLFHVTLCLANMYVTMQLTQWFQPQESTIISFSKSWSTVILKTVCSWLSVLVYLATLLIPALRRSPDRNTQHNGSGHIPPDMWASEETACLQTSHI